MSFRLLDAITLEEGKTGNVSLVPTEKYFKPVLVLNAPLTPQTAALIGASWAFDQFGNPQPFKGSISLTIEIPRAIITLRGEITGEIRLIGETVKHLSVYVQENSGLRVNMRIHLPEDKAQLTEMLDFLSKLNKEKFTIQVEPESLLVGTQPDVPQTVNAVEHPFRIELSKNKPAMIGSVKTFPTGGGFIGSWECKGIGLTGSPAGGQAANDDSPVFEKETGACEWAAGELMNFLKYKIAPNAREVKAVAQLCDWVLELAPTLRKEPAASAVQ